MADDTWPEEVGVPTWLETPATGVGVTLPTVTRPQLLPLNDLTWENFERLCLRYVRGRANVLRSQLYGVKGQAQHGIDLVRKTHRACPLRGLSMQNTYRPATM